MVICASGRAGTTQHSAEKSGTQPPRPATPAQAPRRFPFRIDCGTPGPGGGGRACGGSHDSPPVKTQRRLHRGGLTRWTGMAGLATERDHGPGLGRAISAVMVGGSIVKRPLSLRPEWVVMELGWLGSWARSRHAWGMGTPARLAAARMWATAATGRTAGSRRLPPGDLLQQVGFGAAVEGCCGQHRVLKLGVFAGRGRCARAGTARVALPGAAGAAGAAPVEGVRGEVANTPPGKVLFCECSAHARASTGECWASWASLSSDTWRAVVVFSGWAASGQAYPGGRAEPPITGRPSGGFVRARGRSPASARWPMGRARLRRGRNPATPGGSGAPARAVTLLAGQAQRAAAR